jgi:hypothetical protein
VHNARAIFEDYRRTGEALWPRFTGGRDTLWYYDALAKAFLQHRPGPLAEALERRPCAPCRRSSWQECGRA